MGHKQLPSALLAIAIVFSSFGFAFETDQYNLPDTPLADTGDEISEYIFSNLRESIAELNTAIEKSTACLEMTVKGCESPEIERRKLTKLRSDDAPARVLFKRIGDGNLFRTKFGGWLYGHRFRSGPASYKAPYSETIYTLNPVDYATLSPTFRLYGVELGGDKLEHLLQQGFKYFTIYREERAKGKSESEASAKATAWGRRTERTYFGLISSGVYSNADLFANYAGMKFYLQLTEKSFGKPGSASVLRLSNGRWVFADEQHGGTILKPYISDHLNEALNPSSFRFTLYPSVRRAVKKHACPKWHKAYPDMSQSNIDAVVASLESWNGEDYGHTKRSRTVSIGEACFASK